MESTPISRELAANVVLLCNVLYQSRPWHRREQLAADLHPAVRKMIARGLRPTDWHQLVLEWPHLSEDGKRLAYTNDDRAGEADRQVVTTPGKYLKRHWPSLPDHVIRDMVELSSNKSGFALWDTMDGIIRGVEQGPRSCMRWDIAEPTVECAEENEHPYLAYDPKHGWRMAVRFNDDGRIDGRALVYVGSAFSSYNDTHKGCFVRTYLRRFFSDGVTENYSEADHGLQAWLEEQGYVHRSGWPEGARLARIEASNSNDFLAPYIDGCNNQVNECGSFLTITDDGEFTCDNTDGSASPNERHECSHCGEMHSSTEYGLWAGYYGDDFVGRCCSDEFVHATGRNGSDYYVHQDDAVEVSGDWFHKDYLSYNNIVELADGDYCREDDAIHCPIRGRWYHFDDCRDTEDEGYVHDDEAWQCKGSGRWYSTNIEPVEIDGMTYHPDNAPEQLEAV